MSVQQPESRFGNAAGVNIHYHDVGQGQVLILLHGSGPGASGWSNYSRNVAALSQHFRTIVVDLPGFGKSDMKPVGVPMPGWWADVIRDFMDALAIERADFVGNSMGGMIALKLALTSPERVGRMVLMGPGGGYPLFSAWPTKGIVELSTFYDGPGPSHERLKALWKEFLYDHSKITDELVEERFNSAMDYRAVANPAMRPGPGGPPEELWRDVGLTKLSHDVLLTWGREDRVMPLDLGLVLMRQIPKARLYVFPQCGHWAQWEHPEEFNRIALSFLRAPA